MFWIVTLTASSIVRATVQSLLIPFKADAPSTFPGRRTFRIQGGKQPYKQLVADLHTARGGPKYAVEYRDPAEALDRMEEARKVGDEAEELFWSVRTLPASGHGMADGAEGAVIDNETFGLRFESQLETFRRMWASQ